MPLRSRPFLSPVLSLFLSVASVACSKSDEPSTATEAQEAGADTGPDTNQEWTRLVEGDWTLGAGKENSDVCIKQPITEDVYIHAIRPVHPPGTHHTLLTLGDGSQSCRFAVADGLIYGAGVGSDGLTLPEGVGIKLPAGKVLNLGLHVYNPGDEAISGTSGIDVVMMKPEDVWYESEAVLAGPFDIAIPPSSVGNAKGDCEITADQKIYALFPHMHQYGTHIKTTFTIDGQPRVMHDDDYQFEEQFQLPLDPVIALKAGDKVTTECTYNNTLNQVLSFGESSDTEMCFSILFRYPPQGSGLCGGSGSRPSIPGPPCATAGATGNAEGVGKICTRGGGECNADGGGSASLCLLDVTGGEFGNFCTNTCQTDEACGIGAGCQGTPGRSVCVPNSCSLAPDAGSAASDGGP